MTTYRLKVKDHNFIFAGGRLTRKLCLEVFNFAAEKLNIQHSATEGQVVSFVRDHANKVDRLVAVGGFWSIQGPDCGGLVPADQVTTCPNPHRQTVA